MAFSFDLSLTADKTTGELLAVYIRVRKGKASAVKEFAGGAAFADYNRKGELLGIELLEPCKINVLDRIARNEPAQAKRFVKESVPRHMVASA